MIDDPARVVSGHHCRIDFADGRFWVTDHSANGTRLNAEPLREGNRQPIGPGDTLGLGGFTVAIEAATAPADPADVMPAGNGAQAAWDLDDIGTAKPMPQFGAPHASPDQLHALLDDLITQPADTPANTDPVPPDPDRRLTVFVPDRPRACNNPVAPFWYGLGVTPPALGPDDPAELLIELGAALRALSEALHQRGALGNPLLAGPEAMRQFLATRHPDGPSLDKLVRDAFTRLDARNDERQRSVRSALDTALRSMTPRAVEARFGGMIRGWRRGARRAALLDMLSRMEDQLVELAETRFMRDIEAPVPVEHRR